jgi:PAS domain S-box-containing protein
MFSASMRCHVNEVAALRRELDSLRLEHEQLRRRAGDAEQAVAAFARGEVDAVTLEASATPLLLHAAQDELRRNEQLLRAIFDNALEPMVLTDEHGRYVDANRAACELYQLPLEQLVGRKFAEFTGADLLDDADSRAFRVKGSVRGQVVITRIDGSRRTLEYSAVSNVTPGLDLSVMRDITERTVAEEAVRTSLDLLEKAQAMAHVGSWTSGLGEDDELTWTRECGRIFDVPDGAVITLGQIMTRVHPDDRPRVLRARHDAAAARAPLDIEHRIVRDDGRPCWVRARTSVERWNGVLRMVAVVHDITDRKIADAALRESEERYRRIVENTSEGIWVYNGEGITTFMNARMAEMLGYAIEETIGQPVFAFMEESARAAAEARIARSRSGVSDRSDFHFRRKDGSDLWVSVQANPLFDADGRFEAALALLADVSSERRGDEARARLAAIVEFAGDAIIGASPEGIITSWNAAAETLYQWSASEAIGRATTIVILPENLATVEPVWERLRRGELIQHFETTHVRKDGSTVEVVFTASPIFDAAHQVIGSARIVTDLTERKRAEAALKETEAQLRQAQRMEAVGVLAGGVAHDFNNVLSVILSFTSMMLEDLRQGDPLRADIQQIARAGERASELTRQLLAFSRKQVLQPRVLNLSELLLGMEKMLERLIGEAIELTQILPSSLGSVLVDPGQFEQIVMNLAVNAKDAMPGGGKLSIELVNAELDEEYARLHHDVAPGRYVMLAVTDTGVGMDPATRERVFEPFFTTKEMGKGTGLGLSTVFGIVKQSQGHIWVYSERGQGTTFKVYFPRVEEGVEKPGAEAPEPKTRRGSETVLLVEDEEHVRMATRAILQRNGYHVLDALSGGDALLICEQFPAKIHLLLTDVVMPRMSGPQVAERLRPLRPEMKVLYVSGYTEDSAIHHGVLDAGVAFLQKPLTPTALLRKVREVLDG